MRSTFWPNRICERQSSQNRHTGLKFSPKKEDSALSMKIVQNALFRWCAPGFRQIAFVSVKVVKIVTLASNSLKNGKTVRFPWKLYKTLFSGHAQHVLAKSYLWASKFSKSSHWPQILSKNRKQCAFHENCTKPFFQVMRSTFWPNRIFERQSCQNHHTGLKFSPKRKTARFLWKLYKTLFSGHAQQVLAKSHFWASKFSKSLHWSKILFKTRKPCAFLENCTKRSFQVMRSRFWPNRIVQCQSCQNRHTGLKFPPKRENGAIFIKIVQNPLFRSCGTGFDRIAFFSVKVVKIVTLASNSL